MTNGKPIKTCPKDGSEFLAYDPSSGKFDVCAIERGVVRQTQFYSEWGITADEFEPERAALWWRLPEVTDMRPSYD